MRKYAWMGVLVLMAGCSNNAPTSGPPKGSPQTDATIIGEGKKLLLDAEPAGAKGVIQTRKEARDGDTVVLVGRIGGSAKPFTEGRASFLIVDPSLKPESDCDCPWDFCELPKEELAAARATVKFVDRQGKTLTAGGKELFGVKELSTVVVTGKANRDDKGNLIVVASGLFVRKEKE